MMDTAYISQPIGSGKRYAQIAEDALPILVSQAKAGQTITYSALAEELGVSNPRYTAWILGSIGQTLINLEKRWEQIKTKRKYLPIPSIQLLVVNKNTGVPGDGIKHFISGRKNISDVQEEVFNYHYWDEILDALQLVPVKGVSERLTFAASRLPPKRSRGESSQHKALKEYIHKFPSIVGIEISLKVKQNGGFHRVTCVMFISVILKHVIERVGLLLR